MAEKNYRSFTGLKEFYYGVLDADEKKIKEAAPERIKFLQEINVDTPQEISRAHGDNMVAELATTNGPVTLGTNFHKLPIEDRAVLLGLKTIAGGFAYTPNMTPPYVACAFSRTAEDGGTEWLFFLKGIFTTGGISGKTKEEGGVDFNSDEVNAEFMPREVEGIEDEDEATMMVVYDAKGETTNRDAMFTLVFGVAHPDAIPGA
ncbi:phage tail protein [Sporosarcina sp. P21c]|uniref:major tail protein n=1 Tax=Sporosarcina sp. P21c TaxID=2048255 RepID=UPI000C165902|nr:major tail protein [Sporosarcina sp. P21c]PIC88429.1 phage tail protein [Sporosarcina sp. P21c]